MDADPVIVAVPSFVDHDISCALPGARMESGAGWQPIKNKAIVLIIYLSINMIDRVRKFLITTIKTHTPKN